MNRQLLDRLFAEGKINVNRTGLFDQPPEPLSEKTDFDKVEGMLLGLAIGDALGATSEGKTPSERRTLHGEIRDYLPNKYCKRPLGFPTDDTQLSFWLLEQMLEDGGFVGENVAKKFASSGRIFGLGGTVRGFLRNYAQGIPWQECGPESAGNGALMRIAPIIVPHLRTADAELWVDAALCAMMTHNDAGSIAACLAFVQILWDLLSAESPPEPLWWLNRYLGAARDLEGDARYLARTPHYPDFEGAIHRFVDLEVRAAFRRGKPTVEACDYWYSGAFLLETVPCVLYILMRHGDDPEEAIVRAVNDTRDNDTVAAIVGAAVGALHGRKALPQRWLDGLSGRTTDGDDGRIFDLIRQARQRWWT